MFRIAEEYTKTIKTNPDEKYFFILEKIDFQNFKISKISKTQNFENKSEKSKFEKIEIKKNILCYRPTQLERIQYILCVTDSVDFPTVK